MDSLRLWIIGFSATFQQQSAMNENHFSLVSKQVSDKMQKLIF